MKKNLLLTLTSVMLFSLVSFAQEFSITIDGEKDAFYQTLTGPSNGVVFIPSRALVTDWGGPYIGPWGDADVSAVVWFCYDDIYLYCYAEVKDDTVRATSADRFSNDCLELKFDPNIRAGAGTGTANSRITAKGVDDAEVLSGVDSLNNSGNLKNDSGTKWYPNGDDFARRFTIDGYVVEFRIPFDLAINRPDDNRFMIERTIDSTFGMAINIGDNDDITRTSVIQWSARLSNNVHGDAKYLGSVTFLADHKLKLEAVNARVDTMINDSADVWYELNPTSVKEISLNAKSFKLLSNYPNPFNPSTTFKFSIPAESHVSLTIYNALGEEVEQLVSQEMSAGVYTARWNASRFASGVYFYRLNAGQYTSTKKLLLLK
jgi:hypothetical protein